MKTLLLMLFFCAGSAFAQQTYTATIMTNGRWSDFDAAIYHTLNSNGFGEIRHDVHPMALMADYVYSYFEAEKSIKSQIGRTIIKASILVKNDSAVVWLKRELWSTTGVSYYEYPHEGELNHDEKTLITDLRRKLIKD